MGRRAFNDGKTTRFGSVCNGPISARPKNLASGRTEGAFPSLLFADEPSLTARSGRFQPFPETSGNPINRRT